MPLATDDAVSVGRNGGYFSPPLALWDDVSFLSPNPDSGNRTNQSILGF
jgi:hypothetical protein